MKWKYQTQNHDCSMIAELKAIRIIGLLSMVKLHHNRRLSSDISIQHHSWPKVVSMIFVSTYNTKGHYVNRGNKTMSLKCRLTYFCLILDVIIEWSRNRDTSSLFMGLILPRHGQKMAIKVGIMENGNVLLHFPSQLLWSTYVSL